MQVGGISGRLLVPNCDDDDGGNGESRRQGRDGEAVMKIESELSTSVSYVVSHTC